MFRSPNWQNIYPKAVEAERGFGMLEPGDRVLAAVSGGADSLTLLAVLSYQYKKIGKKLGFSLFPGHIPGRIGGRPLADLSRLERICQGLGHRLSVFRSAMPERVFSDCYLCSRVRRRMLFDMAEEMGCNKVALGHNADDMAETFLMNALYSGRLAALSPRQPVLRGKLTIVRPLACAWKRDIEAFSLETFGRVRTARCPGSAGNRRAGVRRLLASLSRGNHHVKGNLLRAISNPRPEYLPIPRRQK